MKSFRLPPALAFISQGFFSLLPRKSCPFCSSDQAFCPCFDLFPSPLLRAFTLLVLHLSRILNLVSTGIFPCLVLLWRWLIFNEFLLRTSCLLGDCTCCFIWFWLEPWGNALVRTFSCHWKKSNSDWLKLKRKFIGSYHWLVQGGTSDMARFRFLNNVPRNF